MKPWFTSASKPDMPSENTEKPPLIPEPAPEVPAETTAPAASTKRISKSSQFHEAFGLDAPSRQPMQRKSPFPPRPMSRLAPCSVPSVRHAGTRDRSCIACNSFRSPSTGSIASCQVHFPRLPPARTGRAGNSQFRASASWIIPTNAPHTRLLIDAWAACRPASVR